MAQTFGIDESLIGNKGIVDVAFDWLRRVWMRRSSTVVKPQQFRANAGKNSGTITADDIAEHTEWIGTYGIGTKWDTVAVCEAIYAAFAVDSTPGNIVWNGSASPEAKNKVLYIPTGYYQLDKRAIIKQCSGFKIYGDGSRNTLLASHGGENCLYLDECSYFRLQDFGCIAATTGDEPLLEIDATDTSLPDALDTQQITLDNIKLFGQNIRRRGLRISKSGGASQGDTIYIENLFAGGFITSCVDIGYSNAQNALAITFLNGNLQAFQKDGIAVYGGQILVNHMSFQAAPNQLHNGGADINIYAANISQTRIEGIDSESCCLVRGGGATEVRGCSTRTGTFYTRGNNQGFAQGHLIRPETTGGTSDGRIYLVTQGGITGGTLPVWSEIPAGFASDVEGNGTKASIAASGTTLTSSLAVFSALDMGKTIAIQGAGVAGGFLYTTIAGYISATEVELSDPAATTVSSSWFWMGMAHTDGTVKYIPFEFWAIKGCTVIDNVKINAGRISDVASSFIRNLIVTRRDWFAPTDFIGGSDDEYVGVMEGVRVASDGTYYSGTYLDQYPFGDEPDSSGISFKSAVLRTTAILWRGGKLGLRFGTVGIGRGDGAQATAGSQTDLARNVFAVIGTLGKHVAKGTNQVGRDFVQQAGLSTGDALPGKWRVRMPTVGDSGTQVNEPEYDAIRVDETGFHLLDIATGEIFGPVKLEPASGGKRVLYVDE